MARYSVINEQVNISLDHIYRKISRGGNDLHDLIRDVEDLADFLLDEIEIREQEIADLRQLRLL